MGHFNHKEPISSSVSYFGLVESKVPPTLCLEGIHCFMAGRGRDIISSAFSPVSPPDAKSALY